MSPDTPTARCQVQTEDAFGLRMRTAAEFICLAGQFCADIWIIQEGRRYNGRSMRDLLSMVAKPGSRLELEAQGPDAEEAIIALARAVRLYPSAEEGREALLGLPGASLQVAGGIDTHERA